MKNILALLLFAVCAFSQSSTVRDGCIGTGGVTNTYACNYTVAPGWITNHLYYFKADSTNTGSATFNPNSAGAKTLQKWSSGTLSNLSSGDITSGQWVVCVYDGTVCQVVSLGGGGGGGITSLGGLTAGTQTITRGAGIGGSDTTADHSFTTDSTKQSFLSSGALTCGASTNGKMLVHTTPLQYCDNAATPTLQYAAYGDSSGNAKTGDSATAFFSTGTLEVGIGGTGLTTGTSGGVLYYSGTSTLASSGALAANTVVMGGGAGAAPTTGGGFTVVTAGGGAGIAAYNAGTATSLSRSDHTHQQLRSMAWYFPGTPTAGVQVLTIPLPQGITNPSITDMTVVVNTTSSGASTVNIQRCTAGCTGTTPTFSDIYSTTLSLGANTRIASKGSAPNQNVSGLAAGDQFKVNLASVGSGLADVTVSMTVKWESTN